jgi:hypothetical protein
MLLMYLGAAFVFNDVSINYQKKFAIFCILAWLWASCNVVVLAYRKCFNVCCCKDLSSRCIILKDVFEW